ncbi:MAG: YggS family pyridoxal phosphate enzyme [Bacteroidetes bacterium]|jgi:pyridoxal phosphate enzyme (YggS family)|nr:YggS family pyridoxal phosphate enzyme [Bacteroidota bacterium]
MSVKDNLLEIKNTLPPHVTLVAVSKTKPNDMIMEAYDAGHREFGENYVQELTEKHEKLPKDIHWHFIGHLQSNKVKYIVSFVYMIHGVDSFKLLKEINKQAAKNNRVVNCLLQVFIAKEETKFGFGTKECEELFASDELNALGNVNVMGFMGMASNTYDMEQVRNEFKTLKQLQEKLKTQSRPLNVLSFGMSSDYKIAIEEGSTMVRIGSTIFGARNYNNG